MGCHNMCFLLSKKIVVTSLADFVLDGAFIVIAIMERSCFGVQTEYCMFVNNVYAIHCLHY